MLCFSNSKRLRSSLLAGCSVAAAAIILWPNSAMSTAGVGEVKSQTRNCSVVNENVQPSYAGGYPHKLMISCLRKRVYDYAYRRHASVIWAPKSDELAITDYWASDFSKIVILKFLRAADHHTGVKRTDVDLLLGAYLPNGRRLALYGTRYVAATRWQSESQLAVTVTAFGARPIAPDLKGCYRLSLPHSFVKMPNSWCGTSRAVSFPKT